MSTDFVGKVFQIVSARNASNNVQCALVFNGSAQWHSLELPDAAFPWPPLWHVSPDNRWILRTQKTGSGSNGGILYEVRANRVIVPHPWIDQLAWRTWERKSKPSCNNYYHDHMRFHCWERIHHGFSFEIGATHDSLCAKHPRQELPLGMKASCFYDLRTHRVSLL